MNADSLAAALRCGRAGCKCGRKSGASWTSHCPAHHDRNPSLSLSDGDTRTLFVCHAGCPPDAVIEALKARGLWQSAPSRNGRKPKARETRYEVRDTDGKLIAVHLRTDQPDGSKGFSWERAGAKNLGGLPVRELPLYGSERLPALPDGARVVLTEGEKAAEALTGRGLAAVASVTGAAATPGDDALSPLVRLSVALWPDNDEPGRLHMARIADAFRRLGCADVRTVDWRDAPDRGDAADFAGTDAELAALLDGAQPFEAGPAVDPGRLLDDVRGLIRRYVVLTPAQADTLALWVAHVHALDAADVTPYMAVTSPEKRSGKTRLLEVLKRLVARPWMTARTSPAAIYRKVDAESPTLLLDESDAAFKSGDEYSEALRGVLNSGFERGGSTTVCVGQGKDISYREFSTFGAKAIAGIGRLPDTIADRSISIKMKRQGPGEKADKLRRRAVEALTAPLRERLADWALSAVAALTLAEPAIPDELDDRAADAWEPLLGIADAAGGDWPQRARTAALALSVGDAREDGSWGIHLLRDIRKVFTDLSADWLAIADLVAALVAMEEAPWADLKGKPLNARSLGWRLKEFEVKAKQHERAGPRGYDRETFEDAFSRYLGKTDANRKTDATDSYDASVFDDASVFPGMGGGDDAAPLSDACALCGSPDIAGFSPEGETRCAAHYIRETDSPLVLAAVEEMGAGIVARKRSKPEEWALCCDDADSDAPGFTESWQLARANGKRRCQCGHGLSVVAAGDECGRCAAKAATS